MTRYGILLPGRVLAHDHYRDRPATYAHASSARRARLRLPSWVWNACIVRVDVFVGPDSRDTYVVRA